ncbi:MAG TPA: hypothetical protein DDX92_12150 [Flavobacteriales bacterium]|jgi:glycerol-3-phosphate acyltransferase PlsY|nr:hypothetical protein [Flavobacteriales bacterium]
MEGLLGIFLAWQIGSLAIPVWVAKGLLAWDINEGISNRIPIEILISKFKWWPAVLIFLLEMLRAYMALSLIHLVGLSPLGLSETEYIVLLTVAFLIGHLFPVFNSLNGVNSSGIFFGLFIFFWPLPALLIALAYLLIWKLTKRVSYYVFFVLMALLLILNFAWMETNPYLFLTFLIALVGIHAYYWFHKVDVSKNTPN